MGDIVAVNLDPSDEQPQRRRSRTMWELMHPDDVRTSWRDLPALVGSSLRLVWEAGRGVFLLTAALQLLTAIAAGVQLFATKYALESVLKAGGGESFTTVVPAIAILVGLAVVMEVASSVQSEQSRVLGELVARRAYDRVLDVSTKIDLIAYESPDFYDRLRRANMQGQFRSLQTVQSLLGLVGASIAAVGIVVALASLQPWLLPIVLLGYVPLWLVTRTNTRDSYRFAFGMTPNDRQRNYLQNLLLGRDSAKEVRAFNLAPFLRKRYDRLYDERLKELRAVARRRTVRTLAGSLTSSGVAAGAAAALAYLYTSGRLSLAATGAAVFGLYQLRGRLQRCTSPSPGCTRRRSSSGTTRRSSSSSHSSSRRCTRRRRASQSSSPCRRGSTSTSPRRGPPAGRPCGSRARRGRMRTQFSRSEATLLADFRVASTARAEGMRPHPRVGVRPHDLCYAGRSLVPRRS